MRLTVKCIHKVDRAISALETERSLETQPFSPQDFKAWIVESDILNTSHTTKSLFAIDTTENDTPTVNRSNACTILEKLKPLCIRILFHGSAGNWPDRFAQFWVPLLYSLTASTMLAQQFL